MQEDKYKGMRGEFKGDFTRDTFDPINRFSRVLMQQGRVQLDADWNEQDSIKLYILRNLACDLGSEHWGPTVDAGFEISGSGDNDFSIGVGHYYVKGILCEAGLDQSETPFLYSNQPDYPAPENLIEMSDGQPLLVYLDVWERHITYVNDDTIREVALGGPDTATRAKIVWQVKAMALQTGDTRIPPFKQNYSAFLEVIKEQIKPGTGKLCAKVKDKTEDDNDPCLVAPESRYRGAENQLYRVEIHNPGVVNVEDDDATRTRATYKWSRENASVIFPITIIEGTLVTLEHLGRDCRYGLKANDWVEIVDDDYDLENRAEPLLQIESVDEENRQVTLKDSPQSNVGTDPLKHPYLRRWDQKEGDKNGIVVVESSPTDETWIDLEDGIQIQFKGLDEENDPDEEEPPHIYQTGDYWIIPARTATGDVEWPKDDADKPIALLPHGVIHYYAPLAIIAEGDEGIQVSSNLRRILKKSWS